MNFNTWNIYLIHSIPDKSYSSLKAGEWSKQISDEINKRIVELKMNRYKHVVNVMLGQKMGEYPIKLSNSKF